MCRFKIYIGLFLLAIGISVKAQVKTFSFENVNVIPMNRDTILLNQRVIIEDGKIVRIEAANQTSEYPAGQQIKSSGKFLIPGLVETHFHQQNNIENEFKLLIANGVTSARNMAEYEGQDHIEIRDRARRNEILSPYYYTAGPYLKRQDFVHIDSVDAIVNFHKKRGYDYLKIADNLPKDIYVKLLESANEQGVEVVGHGQRKMPLEYSLRMKSIAHMEEFMNIFSTEQKRSDRFLLQAAKEIKSSGVVVSPTLGIFEMIGKYADKNKTKILNADENLKFLPKEYVNYWKSVNINYRRFDWFTTPESLKRLEDELQWQKRFTKILHERGVPLMAGSDTYGLFIPGFSIHHELELLQSSGLTNYETLETATVIPARYLNTISQSGTITEGKLADLVLLDKNPLEDISNTKSISGVMIRGQWFDRKELDRLLLDVEKDYE